MVQEVYLAGNTEAGFVLPAVFRRRVLRDRDCQNYGQTVPVVKAVVVVFATPVESTQ